jgi:hypothetical protein
MEQDIFYDMFLLFSLLSQKIGYLCGHQGKSLAQPASSVLSRVAVV